MPRHGWPDLYLSELPAAHATHAQGQPGSAPADFDQALQIKYTPALASGAVAVHLVLPFIQADNRPQVDHAASVATAEAQEASLRSGQYGVGRPKTVAQEPDRTGLAGR
jgi:hypothetical protein